MANREKAAEIVKQFFADGMPVDIRMVYGIEKALDEKDKENGKGVICPHEVANVILERKFQAARDVAIMFYEAAQKNPRTLLLLEPNNGVDAEIKRRVELMKASPNQEGK
jgi:hypothetical protein